jgi:rod shape-determining protein MreC
MGILREDSFSRRGGTRRQRPGSNPVLLALLFVSLALLVLSRLEHAMVREARLQLEEVLRPVLSVAAVPVEPLRHLGRKASALLERQEELEQLRIENQKLRGWEWRARELERQLAQLGRLANVVEEPGIDFLTARVIADASGPFVRTALLNVGREQGLKPGFPAISADGLVGRLVEPGRTVSRLLLLTDLNSRIPVFVGGAQVRAVLLGDNGPRPKLAYLAERASISPGDEVYTSGDGGQLPRGLRIGVVTEGAGGLVVQPHARLDELDYVSILLFESAASERTREDAKPVSPASARRASGPTQAR